jgi:hypothetical protein
MYATNGLHSQVFWFATNERTRAINLLNAILAIKSSRKQAISQGIQERTQVKNRTNVIFARNDFWKKATW